MDSSSASGANTHARTPIEDAIRCAEADLACYPSESHPLEWAHAHLRIAVAYMKRAHGQRVDNIELTIHHFQLALEVFTQTASPVRWATIQANLGQAYSLRILGDRGSNLERAIAHYRLARKVLARVSHPSEWATISNDLGALFHHRLRGNRARNIERSIRFYEQALLIRTRAVSPMAWAKTQANLASAYCLRTQGDRPSNIERAIECLRLALEERKQEIDPTGWAQTQINLGNAYKLRPIGDCAQNIEDAMACYRLALSNDLRSSSPIDWAMAQANLAAAYRDRQRGEASENLEQALHHLHLALQVRTFEDMPYEWAMTQNELGITYRQRILGDRDANTLCAINCYQKAMSVHTREACPWDWAMLQNNLGLAHQSLGDKDNPIHTSAAIGFFRASLSVFAADRFPVQSRSVSVHLGNLHAQQGQWDDAASAYLIALEASDRLCEASLLRQSREAELLETGDLYRRAGYAFAKTGRLEDAIVILESGRARNLSSTLARDKALLDLVRTARPELLGEYQACMAEIRALEAQEIQLHGASPYDRQHMDAVGRARGRLTTIVEQIGQVGEGIELSGKASIGAISAASEAIPVIYIVASPYGGFALFTRPDAPLRALWIDALSQEVVAERLFGRDSSGRSYVQTYAALRANRVSPTLVQAWKAALEGIVHWLAEVLVLPLCDELVGMQVKEAYLVPFGPLSLLPIHAVSDRLALAYTPNARMLRNLRSGRVSREASVLVVEDPEAEGTAPLSLGRVEVAPLLQMARPLSRLSGQEATKDRLLHDLTQHEIWHFAAHGEMNWDNALDSCLLLSGQERLALRDMLPLRLDASLAVLSACETGLPDNRLYDEVISLATGMLQAGAGAVVSSLWAVEDLSTALLMRRFYQLLMDDADGGASVASSLHAAQVWLSRLKRDEARQLLMEMMSDPDTEPRAKDALMDHFVLLEHREERPFAHPYYWAAFYATGNAFAPRCAAGHSSEATVASDLPPARRPVPARSCPAWRC